MTTIWLAIQRVVLQFFEPPSFLYFGEVLNFYVPMIFTTREIFWGREVLGEIQNYYNRYCYTVATNFWPQGKNPLWFRRRHCFHFFDMSHFVMVIFSYHFESFLINLHQSLVNSIIFCSGQFWSRAHHKGPSNNCFSHSSALFLFHKSLFCMYLNSNKCFVRYNLFVTSKKRNHQFTSLKCCKISLKWEPKD